LYNSDDSDIVALATIRWEGDSRKVLAAFPEQVRKHLGHALFNLQQGVMPLLSIRRMQSIGHGVYELKDSDRRSWYRLIYLATVNDTIYVLHCFEKTSRKTERPDLKVARSRLSKVLQRIREERSSAP
jgi:phage-related protein